GTMHLLFLDIPKGGKPTVFHRTSTDNGATWGTAQRLGQRDHAAGMPRVAIDGQGRVYAIWKDMSENGGNWMTAHDHDSLRGGSYARLLVGAVLTNGTWSDPFPISEAHFAQSWFPSVDPTGKLHVVWTEQIKAPTGYQTQEPARVMQATLSGATVEGRKALYTARPDEPDTYDGTVWHYERLDGIRGYVDAQGAARWVTTRTPSQGEGGDPMVVHWDGTKHVPLFKRDAYGVGNTYHNPPELVVDAAGQAHVIVEDIVGERKGVLDFTVGNPTPTPIRQVPEASGSLQTFQLARGPGGQLAAMMSMEDRADANTEFELFVSRYENGQWTPGVNITHNAQRGAYKEFGTRTDGVQTSSVFEPIFASGAFDAQGKLNVAMVNMERIYTNFASTGTVGGSATTVNQGAAAGIPRVYFVRL
ncbi:MAG: sialidase family protein, partial [Candidatus Sericytochromatia bacterium]